VLTLTQSRRASPRLQSPHSPRSQLVLTLFIVISNPNPNPNPNPSPNPNQLVLTLFFVISPFLEVISQTAQAFLPAYAAPPPTADREAWRAAALALASRLLRLGTVVGGVARAHPNPHPDY